MLSTAKDVGSGTAGGGGPVGYEWVRCIALVGCAPDALGQAVPDASRACVCSSQEGLFA